MVGGGGSRRELERERAPDAAASRVPLQARKEIAEASSRHACHAPAIEMGDVLKVLGAAQHHPTRRPSRLVLANSSVGGLGALGAAAGVGRLCGLGMFGV